MTSLDARLGSLLSQRKEKNRFRSLKEYDPSTAHLIDFSSNDYLSLTTSPTLRESYLKQLRDTPEILGSTGSRLLSGGTPAHRALENRFAEFFDSPSALLFNSGWDANVSFFSTVPQIGDWIIYDELVHASVHDGMRGSRVSKDHRRSFAHNDPIAFRTLLQEIVKMPSGSKSPTGTVFLAMESLYSMDGDFACLPALLDIFDEYVPRHQQCIVLDEAHTTGVYGHGGRGITHALGEHCGANGKGSGRLAIRLMTFGKAVGCSGAVLLCSPTIRSFLINFARPLIFSTALPHSTLIALHCAWDLLASEEGEHRRQTLMALTTHTHSLLKPRLEDTPNTILSLPPTNIPFAQTDSVYVPSNPLSPIIGLLTPKPHILSAFLLDRGYIVRPVVPPTVPPGKERVRICLRADMGEQIIQGLVKALQDWVDQEKRSKLISGRESRTLASYMKAKL